MAIVYSIITEGLHLVNQESPCFGTQKGESEASIPAFPGDTALFGPVDMEVSATAVYM